MPSRRTSALREVSRSRDYLDAARSNLEVALSMLGSPDGEASDARISGLQQALRQLQEVEATLWEASR
jgi:hypothetical protein